MVRLYNCYSEEDKVILIGKYKGLENEIREEKAFELTEEIEKDYLIFAYNEEHKIFNNGYRHIYGREILGNLQNIKVVYGEEGILEEFGIEDEEGYTVVYINYSQERFRADMKRIYQESSEDLLKQIMEINRGEKVSVGYFYNGESVNIIVESGDDEIHLSEKGINDFEAMVLSVEKDGLADEVEVVQYIVNAVYKKLEEELKRENIEIEGPNEIEMEE